MNKIDKIEENLDKIEERECFRDYVVIPSLKALLGVDKQKWQRLLEIATDIFGVRE